jgi:hypothetical protein
MREKRPVSVRLSSRGSFRCARGDYGDCLLACLHASVCYGEIFCTSFESFCDLSCADLTATGIWGALGWTGGDDCVR